MKTSANASTSSFGVREDNIKDLIFVHWMVSQVHDAWVIIHL